MSLLGTNPSFLRWEALADKDTMKYGSRCYIKGVPKGKEKLFGHMVRTLEGNAKRRPQMGQGVAAATKEGGKRGQRVAAVSSPVVVVAKGQKGQGVAAATTKQGGERKRGQSRVAASLSPVPVVGGRSEMIVAPTANATAASGSVGGKAILPPQFSAATGEWGMSNEIALSTLSSLHEPGNV